MQQGGTWRPSHEQELLLRAALREGDEARDAWREWAAATKITGLDQGSYRLLPLLYLNLQSLQVQDPDTGLIHALYLHMRRQNEIKLRRAAATLEILNASGIPTIVLKATALIPLYYRDPGARPMGDIDILVPTAQAWHTLELLHRAGWEPAVRPMAKMTQEYFLRSYAHTLRSPDNFELDLHRHLFYFETRDDGDAAFWEGAIPVRVGAVETLALCPTDQLLHILTHGADWNVIPPIRWIADAYVLLRQAKMDWQRFLELAERCRVILLAHKELEYLREAMGANIPAEVLAALGSMPVSRTERLRYELGVKPKWERSAALKLWYHYAQFRRQSRVYQNEKWYLRFPAFLRDTWELNDVRAVPGHMLRVTARSFTRRFQAGYQVQGEK